jgi:hypothetical protein
MEVATCAFRLEVAIAQVSPRTSIAAATAATEGAAAAS